MSFFPVDREILTSSIWVEGTPEELKIWFYLMISANPRDGIVRDTAIAIAQRCGLPVETVTAALKKFSQPDRHSRTDKKEGRRIETCRDGFRLVTYRKHRDKDYSTPRVRKYRGKKRTETSFHTVSDRSTVTETTDTDTDTDTDKDNSSKKRSARKKRREETPARAPREQCSAGAEPGEIPLFHSGVKWSKVEGKVEMLPDFRRWLTQHLKELSTQEGLHVELTPAEAQESWGRLNGHMLRNTHKTGKALPSIVVNWFENDLRRKAGRKREQSVRGRSKTANSLAAIDRWEERILAREAEEMDESICACPRDHETESLVTQGVREYCPDACGWSRLAPGISDGR